MQKKQYQNDNFSAFCTTNCKLICIFANRFLKVVNFLFKSE